MKAIEFKVLRQQKKLSTTVMANALGVSKGYISLLENGKRPITLELEKKIKKKFKSDHVDNLKEVAERKLIDLVP